MDKSACVLGTSVKYLGMVNSVLDRKGGSWAWLSFIAKLGGE